MINADATPRKDPAAEQLVHEIEEHAARLRKILALVDHRIACDEVAQRDEADRLRRYVDTVLARVATLENQVRPSRRDSAVSQTVTVRTGKVQVTAPGQARQR